MGKGHDPGVCFIGFNMDAQLELSRSARKVLFFYASRLAEGGDEEVARVSREAVAKGVSLSMAVVERAIQKLVEKGFLFQAGYNRMAVNPEMLWLEWRDRAELHAAQERFEAHKQAYATTLAKKQAAGREAWRRRQAAKGGDHGVVEQTRGPRKGEATH